MKQRREKALQNTKDRKLEKENFLAVLKADHKANRVSNDIQSSANMNDELLNGSNTDIIIGFDNTAIITENADNAATDTENINNEATNAENMNNAAINADFTINAATDSEKSDATISGNGDTENTAAGETSMIDVPSPLLYGRKTTDPSKVKTSKRHIPIMVKPSEPSIGDPPPNESTTVMVCGHAFDPTDVHVYEYEFNY